MWQTAQKNSAEKKKKTDVGRKSYSKRKAVLIWSQAWDFPGEAEGGQRFQM